MNQTGNPEPGMWNAAKAVEEFRRLRGTEPFGPFVDLLVSPELMTRVSALGEYLRYRSALPPRLSEFAILITAAHWQQRFEWDIHAPIALQAGIAESTVEALWNGEHPANLDEEAQALYDVCIAIHQDHVLPRHIRQRAEERLGAQATIDAIGICGYYALLAMILNSR